jgi:hypothetical protein
MATSSFTKNFVVSGKEEIKSVHLTRLKGFKTKHIKLAELEKEIEENKKAEKQGGLKR